VDLLALTFIGARILHGIFYIADLDKLRSLVWFIGVACTCAIFLAGSA
jgi:uncharacterized MAPEG superfamily protein